MLAASPPCMSCRGGTRDTCFRRQPAGRSCVVPTPLPPSRWRHSTGTCAIWRSPEVRAPCISHHCYPVIRASVPLAAEFIRTQGEGERNWSPSLSSAARPLSFRAEPSDSRLHYTEASGVEHGGSNTTGAFARRKDSGSSCDNEVTSKPSPSCDRRVSFDRPKSGRSHKVRDLPCPSLNRMRQS